MQRAVVVSSFARHGRSGFAWHGQTLCESCDSDFPETTYIPKQPAGGEYRAAGLHLHVRL